MDDIPRICPKCQSRLTLLQGGLRCCPICGFEGDTPKISPGELDRRSPTLFWILLVAPASLGLLSLVVGQFGDQARNLGVMIGFIAVVLGLVSSLYCSIWLVRRFSQPGSLNLLSVFFLLVVFAAVNFAIAFAGCASNIGVPW